MTSRTPCSKCGKQVHKRTGANEPQTCQPCRKEAGMFTCPICGKRFYIMQLARRIEGTACSRECRVIKVRNAAMPPKPKAPRNPPKTWAEYDPANPSESKPKKPKQKLLKVCQGCGNEFTPKLRGAVCCSMECARRVVLAEES